MEGVGGGSGWRSGGVGGGVSGGSGWREWVEGVGGGNGWRSGWRKWVEGMGGGVDGGVDEGSG